LQGCPILFKTKKIENETENEVSYFSNHTYLEQDGSNFVERKNSKEPFIKIIFLVSGNLHYKTFYGRNEFRKIVI
jgi:hypothetical protein